MLVEPAANPAPLELIVQAAGEGLIGMAVADKAGVELEGAPDQRFDVGDEIVGNARPPEKDLGDVALRAIERVDTDNRRAYMLYGIKSLNQAQVDILVD